jgi:hypothetical protein
VGEAGAEDEEEAAAMVDEDAPGDAAWLPAAFMDLLGALRVLDEDLGEDRGDGGPPAGIEERGDPEPEPEPGTDRGEGERIVGDAAVLVAVAVAVLPPAPDEDEEDEGSGSPPAAASAPAAAADAAAAGAGASPPSTASSGGGVAFLGGSMARLCCLDSVGRALLSVRLVSSAVSISP